MTSLTNDDRKFLLDLANEARRRAYAPYSGYKVGVRAAHKKWKNIYRCQCRVGRLPHDHVRRACRCFQGGLGRRA